MDALDAIDEDIRAACCDRAEAWRKLCIRDDQANRETYAELCDEVDALLELRHGMTTGVLHVSVI